MCSSLFDFSSDCWGFHGRLQDTEHWTGICFAKAIFLGDSCWNISGTGSYPYEAMPVADSYLPSVSSICHLFVCQTHRLPQHSCQAEQTAAVHHSSPSVHPTSQISEVATGDSVQALQTANELRCTRTEIWCETARTNLQHSEWSEAVQAWYFVPASLQQFVCTCCYSLWMLYVHFSKSTCPKSDRKWQWLSTIVLGLLHKYIKI